MFYIGWKEEGGVFIKKYIYQKCLHILCGVHLGTKTIKIRQETNIVNFLPHQCKLVILTAQLVSPVSPSLFLLFLFISSDLKDDIRNCSTCAQLRRNHKDVK